MAVSFHKLFLGSFLLLSLTSVQSSRDLGTDYIDNYENGNYGSGRLSYGNIPLYGNSYSNSNSYGNSYSNIAPSVYHPEEDSNFREPLNDGYNLPTLGYAANYGANYGANYATNYATNYEGLGRNYAGPYNTLYQNPLLGAIYGGPQPGYNPLGSSNYGNNYPNLGSSYANNGASYGTGVSYPSARAGYPSADSNYVPNSLLGTNYASAGATYPSSLNSYDNPVADYGSIGSSYPASGSYSPGSGSLAVNPLSAGVPLAAGVPSSVGVPLSTGVPLSAGVSPSAGVPLSAGYRTGVNYPQGNPLRSVEYEVGLNNPLVGANNYGNGLGYSQPNPVVAAEVYSPSIPIQNGELYNSGYNLYPRIQPLYVPTPCSGLGMYFVIKEIFINSHCNH